MRSIKRTSEGLIEKTDRPGLLPRFLILILAGMLSISLIACEENSDPLLQPGLDDPDLQFFLETFGKGAGEFFPSLLGAVDLDSQCALSLRRCEGMSFVDSLDSWVNGWEFFGFEYEDRIQFLLDGELAYQPDTSEPFAMHAVQVLTASGAGEYLLEVSADRDLSQGGHNSAKVNATGSIVLDWLGGDLPGGSDDCQFQVDYVIAMNNLIFGGEQASDPRVPWSGTLALNGTAHYSCPQESSPRISGNWSIRVTFEQYFAITRVTHQEVSWTFVETPAEGYRFWNP